jgi:hypothetical protein
MMKKAFRMLGINEDENPTVVKDRIIEQLTEEASKLGASVSKGKRYCTQLSHYTLVMCLFKLQISW